MTKLRSSEKEVIFYELESGEANVAVYDQRKVTKLSASLGIVTTLFICVVLAAGSLVISKVT